MNVSIVVASGWVQTGTGTADGLRDGIAGHVWELLRDTCQIPVLWKDEDGSVAVKKQSENKTVLLVKRFVMNKRGTAAFIRHGREIFYLNWMEMTCWDGGLSFFYLFIFLLEHSVSRIMSRLFGLPNDSLIHFFFSALKRQIFCPVRTSFSNKLSCESYISALYRNISMAEEHCGTQGV